MATVAAWATAVATQEQSTTVNEERRKKKEKATINQEKAQQARTSVKKQMLPSPTVAG